MEVAWLGVGDHKEEWRQPAWANLVNDLEFLVNPQQIFICDLSPATFIWKPYPNKHVDVGPAATRGLPGVGPQSFRHRTTVVPTSDHSRSDIGPQSFRHRTTVVPTSDSARHRLQSGYVVHRGPADMQPSGEWLCRTPGSSRYAAGRTRLAPAISVWPSDVGISARKMLGMSIAD